MLQIIRDEETIYTPLSRIITATTHADGVTLKLCEGQELEIEETDPQWVNQLVSALEALDDPQGRTRWISADLRSSAQADSPTELAPDPSDEPDETTEDLSSSVDDAGDDEPVVDVDVNL